MKFKKTIAAIAAAAMVFTSLPMIAFAATHSDDSKLKTGEGAYEQIDGDEDNHKHLCNEDDCEGKTEAHQAEAQAAWTVKDGKHVKVCVCGKVVGTGHDPKPSTDYVTSDATNHYKTCTETGCTLHIDEAAHKTAAEVDWNAEGKKVCSCGKVLGTCAHSDKTYDSTKTAEADNKHVETCDDCGMAIEVACATDDETLKKDADGHWSVCDTCHKAFDEDEHNDGYDYDDEGHWKVCDDCGWVTETKKPHNFTDGDNNAETADTCEDCGATEAEAEASESEMPTNPTADTKPSEQPVTPPQQENPPVVTPDPEPEAPAADTSSSSAAASTGAATTTVASSPAEVRSATKPNVTVDASETKVTPAIVNAFTKNSKTKTLTVSYGNNVKVAIDKSDVKGVTANLDFSVSGKNFISSKAISNNKTLSKAAKVVQMDFVKEGKINGIDQVTVKNRVGAKYVGQKATIYEYVDGKLVKIATAKVGGSGLVSFKVDHLGKFVIAVE